MLQRSLNYFLFKRGALVSWQLEINYVLAWEPKCALDTIKSVTTKLSFSGSTANKDVITGGKSDDG